jgi:hypothetical protein
MMLFRQVNRKKSTHCTPLIWRLQAPDQGSMVGGLLSVSTPQEQHESARFADVAAIQERPLIWRLQVPDQGSMVGGLLSVSPPQEQHERSPCGRRRGKVRLS